MKDDDVRKTAQEINEMLREIKEMGEELEKSEAEFDKFMDQMRQLDENGRLDFPYRLSADYPAPREILRQHFPRTANQCCFKGGWGYDAGDAVIVREFDPEINPDEKFDGVSLEYAFIDKRIREELIFSRPEGERFEQLDYQVIRQELHDLDGVPHDFIEVEVTAYPEKEWNELKADWEAHDGYKDDPEGRKENLKRKEACKITYRTEFWFNIENFF
ncbi:MAG: hypothetical protein IJS14_11125 [Lentisphaeria bacterium]|nr:hypothetical protein [Lentisphaeria bacterium]